MDASKVKGQRPCDNCRRRKIRCLYASEDAQTCVLCMSRGTECSYVQEPPRKRRMLSVGKDKPASEALEKQRSGDNRAVPVLHDYSNLPGISLLKETLGHQNRQSNSVLGDTGDFDRCLLAAHLNGADGQAVPYSDTQNLRLANADRPFLIRADTVAESAKEIADLDAVEAVVAPHGPDLVELYFRIVHPSFPILHKKVFLEKHGRNYRELTPIGLGSVYIMALGWWSYSTKLAKLPKPDVSGLEKSVQQMLFEAHLRPKISDLQGGLVLMQRPNVNSWAMIGHLTSIAQNLGIDHDCSDWHIPDWERGVRKRVAWALYMQDKWGSLVYGRSSHIRLDDWDVQPLDDCDFPETARDDDDQDGSAEVERGKQTFLQMVALTTIVADILDTFYRLRPERRPGSLEATLDKARPIQLRLRAWFADLPATLSIVETGARRLSSVGYLHLAYYTAEVALHRAIIRASLAANVEINTRKVLREAASARVSSAVNFVKNLKQEHLQSFWYYSSSRSLAVIGTLAAMLISSSSEFEDRDALLSKLAEYRWTLRISSNGAEFMKYAVDVLDAQNGLLEQQVTEAAMQATDPSEYVDESPVTDTALISPAVVDWSNGFESATYTTEFGTLDQFNVDAVFDFEGAG